MPQICRIVIASGCMLFAPLKAWDRKDLGAALSLSDADWQSVDRGDIFIRNLKRTSTTEVGVLGVARVAADANCAVTLFRDTERFRRGPMVKQVHKMGQPVQMHDLQSLSLSAEDIAALKECTAGDCAVKLPLDAIQSIRRTVDWSAPDSTSRANEAFRQWLLGYIRTYLSQGSAALAVYRDKTEPVSLAQELRALLDAEPRLRTLGPAFFEYLVRYPEAKPPDVDDYLYWSKEEFGAKPLISVTHVSVWETPGHAMIASTQIFADHYIDGSLGLTFALDTGGTSPGMYLVYLNRSRVDLLSGWLGGLRRIFVQRRITSALQDNLQKIAERLKTTCATH